MSFYDLWYSTNPKYCPITPEMLLFSGAVQFGSRALKVDTQYSDYDFAILRSNYNKLIENYTPYRELNTTNYFKVLPPKGYPTMVREFILDKQLDILIVDYQSDLEIIRKSVQDTMGLPIKSRTNKLQRINTFENTLLRNGFKLHWKYKVIRWFTKLTNTPTGLWLPR